MHHRTGRSVTGARKLRMLLLALLASTALVAAACTTPGGGGTTNTGPTARASASPTSGDAPLTVIFSSAGSTDPDGTIVSYRWDFGDGSLAVSGQSPSYTYETPGTYTAVLQVTDNVGATSSASVVINVGTSGNLPPVAVATATTPTTGKAPFTVGFSSAGTNDPDGTIVSYRWDWGDSTASGTTANPSHVFSTAGTFVVRLTVTDNLGATGQTTIVVTAAANVRPQAVATATPPVGVVPNTVQFSSAGSVDPDGTIVSYRWNFGDGSPLSTQPNPTKTYSTVGTRTVTLTVTDDTGATDVATIQSVTLPVNINPVAVANAGPTSGKAPLTVAFSSAGSVDTDGTIVSYAWDFGDGSGTSTQANPSYTYTAPGTRTATLVVTDDRGGTAQATVVVNVSNPNVPPVPQASATPTSGKEPLVVAFSSAGTADSDGTVVAYEWDFNDGSPRSSAADPSHTFAAAGTYVVLLKVTDDDGATATVSTTVTVLPNVAPVAAAAGTPTAGKGPLTVQFSSAGSNDPFGSIVSYNWDFGDGSPVSTDENPSHTYAPGQYTATLTVTDDNGATDTAQVDIDSFPNVVPTAVANSDVAAGNAPLTVAFSSLGSIDPDGSIAAYEWDFDDGSPTSADPNPTHTFTAAGVYSVVLTVTDDEGAEGTTVVTITVAPNPPPVADIVATPESGKEPLEVAFSSAGSTDDGSIVARSWDFGDGGTSTDAEPTHTYTAAGNYVASLTVTDNGGLTTTATKVIEVLANQPPVAVASATPLTGQAPLLVQLSAAGSNDPLGSIVSYSWDFGDGSGTSSLANPTHVYAEGSWTATLTVTDDNGATGTDTVDLVVTEANRNPVAVANAGPTSGKAPLTVSFSSLGSNDSDGSIVAYSWDFGDGSPVSTDPNPTKVYATPGTRTATLTVTDNQGATGTATVTVAVGAFNVPPSAQGTATPSSGKRPLTVSFDSAGSTDGDGTIVSRTWDFGDGSPTASGPTASYTYPTPGLYTATLTLTDDDGATSTKTFTITVNPNQAPTAQAAATPNTGKRPLTVAFSSAGSTDADGTIAAYAWDFGDGTGTSTDPNPSYTYPDPGTYSVTLTVTDDEGATGTRTIAVVVLPNAAPTAVLNSDRTSGVAPLAVQFSSAASVDPDGTIASTSWDFGDGGTSTDANPAYTFTQAGDYTVTLTVTDNDGASATATRVINVFGSAVFVRTGGNDANVGTTGSPKATIAGGLAAAQALGINEVRVAGGSYAGFAAASGITVAGGYDQSFTLGGGNGATTVTVTGASGAPGVSATGLTQPTTLLRLTIVGGGGANSTGVLAQTSSNLTLDTTVVNSGTPTGAGASAYGVRSLSNSTVTVTNSQVTAQSGVAGAAGTPGTPGTAAANGGDASGTTSGGGTSGTPTTRNGGAGGGGGGGNFAISTTQRAGSAGGNGGGGAAGGTGGPASTSGVGGGGGAAGSQGAATAGGSGATASGTPGDTYAGTTGTTGGAGGSGTGGGGGGGGGGFDALTGARRGGGGGGGGLGGVGGAGGTGGGAGGGSFAVFAHNASLSVQGSVLTSGNGGAGGAGGAGGDGGAGGRGGNGGIITNNPAGGGGGGGGAGGRGGSGGGGGLGGPSVGAYRTGSGSLKVVGTTVNLGSAGTGGAGGAAGAGGSGGAGGALGTSNTSGRNGFAGAAAPAGGSGNVGGTGAAGLNTARTPANTAPSAQATATPSSGKAPLTVSFSSAGSTDADGSIASYAWAFGDGGTSTAANPSYTYTTPGTYTATLTVTDDEGATSSTSRTIVVNANVAPTAVANATPNAGKAPLGVNFSSAGSSDPDGSIASYAWDFGDGGTSTTANPSYTYAAQGTYTATLTVTDDNGATGSATVTVTVNPANVGPTAGASATPTSGKEPLTVSFTDSSTDADGTIAARLWTFGAGGPTSTATNPSFTFTTPGTYTVTLTVTDDDGATAMTTVTVTVDPNQGPTAVAAADVTDGPAPLEVNFSSASSSDPDGSIVSYAWDFGDGNTSTAASPSNTFADPGTYTVELTVTDDNGATATSTVEITVT